MQKTKAIHEGPQIIQLYAETLDNCRIGSNNKGGIENKLTRIIFKH